MVEYLSPNWSISGFCKKVNDIRSLCWQSWLQTRHITSNICLYFFFFWLILIRNLASSFITTHRSNFLTTATHHRFNFLQRTTTHRIFLNCHPQVAHMFEWNSPYHDCTYVLIFKYNFAYTLCIIQIVSAKVIFCVSYFFLFGIHSEGQTGACHLGRRAGSWCARSAGLVPGSGPPGSAWCSSWPAAGPGRSRRGARTRGHGSEPDSESETELNLTSIYKLFCNIRYNCSGSIG